MRHLPQLQETVAEHHPGDKIKITYFRNGKEETASVELKNVDGTTAVVLESTGETVFGSKLVPLTSRRRKNMPLIPEQKSQVLVKGN